eukprot:jgi/Chrpa1/26854/Chrysochromulina_OHIO_Genome00001673-RA
MGKKRDARSKGNGADEEKACFQSDQGCQRALFLGSLDHVFNAELSKASKRLAIERGMSKDLASDAMKKRAILYLFQLLEGWVVSMARWVLQAAATSRVSASGALEFFGSTMVGRGDELLRECAPGMEPSPSELVAEARRVGVVSRVHLRSALAHCVVHHNLLPRLHERGASLAETNSFGWSALHLAAALGAPLLVHSLISMHANTHAHTITGLTPLHIAATHGSTEVAALLADALPPNARTAAYASTTGEQSADESLQWQPEWLDMLGRSPEDLAIGASGRIPQCMRLLLVIQKGASKNATNSSSEGGVQRVSMRKRRCAEQRRSARSSSEVKPTDMHDRSWEVLKAGCTGDAAVEEAAEAAGAEESAEAVGAAEAAEAAGAMAGMTGAARKAVRIEVEIALGVAEKAASEEEAEANLCDVEVVDARSIDTQTLVQRYLSVGTPVLVRGSALPPEWADEWARDVLSARLGDVALPLETYPYADASATVIAVPQNRTRLRALLSRDGGRDSIFGCSSSPDEQQQPQVAHTTVAQGMRRDRRHRHSLHSRDLIDDEPPKSVFMTLMGWRYKPATLGSRQDIELSSHGAAEEGRRPLYHGEEAPSSAEERRSHARLLHEWRRPPFIQDASDTSNGSHGGSLLRTSTIQFYVGGARAGAQPHWHEAAWNWLVRGRKRWLLWTPESATYAQRHSTLALDAARRGGRAAPLTCIQQAGDVMLLPAWWGHATINLKPSIGFATEVHFDRTIELLPANGTHVQVNAQPEPRSTDGSETAAPVCDGSEQAEGELQGSFSTCSTAETSPAAHGKIEARALGVFSGEFKRLPTIWPQLEDEQ